jgi:hypothetical protein
VCGETLFSLAHQGRALLPGKFTGIDRMTNSGGGQDISGYGFRRPVEVIIAPCQTRVAPQLVPQFEFQQSVGSDHSLKRPV